ncbi:MAG: DUF4391 domain-containing protein [Candidatus Sericytochromatia bacterium]|nr:DUF4391 domain-containing protein [Candidatus Sericytochromatia bacterium]
MKILDNLNTLWGDDLKQALQAGARLKIAASCFSIYAYEALKSELAAIESLQFIFTSPAFIADEATDKFARERREFHIPKLQRERSLYGSDFEIQLKNKLTQKAIARECASWIRRKAQFRSNATQAPMQQFAGVQNAEAEIAYMPLQGFTAVDLGYLCSDWLPAETAQAPLPLALNLESLYHQLLQTIAALPPRPDESPEAWLSRYEQLQQLQAEHTKIERQLHKEKQFKRKVTLNRNARQIQADIEQLLTEKA